MGFYVFKVPVMTQYGTLGGKVYDSADFEPGFLEGLESAGLVEPYISDKEVMAKDQDLDNRLNGKADKGELETFTAQLAEKAKQSDLEIERARINNLATLPQGSTTGDAELIDGRVGDDGVTYQNVGTAVRTQLKNIKKDVYDTTYIDTLLASGTDYDYIPNFGISGTNTVNSKFTKALLEPVSNTHKFVAIKQVTPGETYKVTGYTLYNVYNSLGIIFSDTKWDFATYTTSNRINIISGNYDYYGNQTGGSWATFVDYEVTVPAGASYMYIRGEAVIKRKTPQTVSKIPVKVSQLTNDILPRKTVFPITSAPTSTVGTVTEELYKTRRSKKAYRWNFNTVGSITFDNIQFVSEANDVVGVWIYVNHHMLNQPDGYDGIVDVYVNGVLNKNILTAYSLHAGWNYLRLNNISAGNNNISLKFNFTTVKKDYVLIVDSIELNYNTKPKVLICFDMFGTDGYNVRYPLLDQRGLRGTFCNPDLELTDTQIRELMSKGWDWSVYGGLGTQPNWTTGTLEEWKTYLKAKITAIESRGLFNPIAYFSPSNRGSQTLMDAEKALGYRMSRIACAGNYYMDYFNRDGFYIYTYGIGGTTTAQQAIDVLNQALATGTSVCFFTHQVQDTLTDNMHCLRSVFEPILDYIKQAQEAGKCDVVTFREFYQLSEPADYAEYMNNRHEKEKNYILSKLT